jgi:quinoprotein glucose dehydrogenase
MLPGLDGGAEWGGPAFDPKTGLLYVNANEVPWVITMVDINNEKNSSLKQTNLEAGMYLYRSNCMGCHGERREGGGNYPSLIGVNSKYNETTFMQLLASGRRMMPAFNQLSTSETTALASFILNLKSKKNQLYVNNANQKDYYLKMPYSVTGYIKFRTLEGYPAINPPWGTLSAINLNTGKVVWRDTLGDYPELKAKGIHSGTENYGGSVVTAGGLLFIAATKDAKFRAFNKRTGKLLWETDLPAAGFATPAVYQVNGKQYLVIACGGGKLKGAASGDAYVAFSLPDKN